MSRSRFAALLTSVREVVVVAAQHAQPLERLVVDLEPMQPACVGARGVRQHEAVAAVGLGLARVELGGAAHHQPRHVGDRHPAPARDQDRQRPDRARLVDHQRTLPALAGPVEQPLDRRLVVSDSELEQPLARRRHDGRVMVLLADIKPHPRPDPPNLGLVHPTSSPLALFSCRPGPEGRPAAATLRTSPHREQVPY
jgi:hypothetical protein